MMAVEIQKPLHKEVEEVMDIIGSKGFIAGGCPRYFAVDDEIPYSDIDVYCKSEEYFNDICQALEKAGWQKTSESVNAVRYRKSPGGVIVEVIKPFQNEHMKTFGEPEEVIQQFDFTVTKAYFKDKRTVVVDEALIEDVKRRRLIITSIPCPIAVAQRVTKYARKGFSIGVRELVKLFIEWDRRDRQYKNRLQELLSNPELSDEDFEELERLLRVD